MSRQNPEDYLVPELEACILGLPIPIPGDGKGQEYADSRWDHPGDELGGGGSNNWAGMALGCRYSLVYRARGFDPIRAAGRYLDISKTKFLGSEIDSSIYTWMVSDTVLEIAAKSKVRGDQGNYQKSMEWLEYLACRNLLFYDEGAKRILHVGERSAAHPKPADLTWQDHFLRAVMGWGQVPKYEKVLVKNRILLLDVGAKLRSGIGPIERMRDLGYRTIRPVRVIAWPKGKAVWSPGIAMNGNTQAVKAAVYRDGGPLVWAPKNRGYFSDKDRRHRRPGKSAIQEVIEANNARVLVYESPVYEGLRLAIPGPDQRTLDVEIGGADVVRDLRVSQPASPASTPVPSPFRPLTSKPRSILESIGDWFRGLFD